MPPLKIVLQLVVASLDFKPAPLDPGRLVIGGSRTLQEGEKENLSQYGYFTLCNLVQY